MIIWFWTFFVGAVILWYILVTVLVGFKGAQDILKIFRGFNKQETDDS